jgi:hypothetical protein
MHGRYSKGMILIIVYELVMVSAKNSSPTSPTQDAYDCTVRTKALESGNERLYDCNTSLGEGLEVLDNLGLGCGCLSCVWYD